MSGPAIAIISDYDQSIYNALKDALHKSPRERVFMISPVPCDNGTNHSDSAGEPGLIEIKSP